MRLETALTFSGLIDGAEGWETVRTLEITGVACDSRRVRPGDLFVAIPGAETDGHRFLEQAAQAGAVAALVQQSCPSPPIPCLRVADTRRQMGPLAAAVYGHPGERLYTVGVTGTSGKTTTTHLIRGLLASRGTGVGLIGTVTYRVAGAEQPAPFTTPESAELHRLLAQMWQGGDRGAVLEVSSHALVLGRIEGLLFDVVCFTNLGRDHLDFHSDQQAYRRAKAQLLHRHRKPGGTAVVNVDDPVGAELAAELEPPVVTVGVTAQAQVRADQIEVGPGGIGFDLIWERERARLRSPLLGQFNLENLLVAAAVGKVTGLDPAESAAALERVEGIPGRMELLPGPPGVLVLLDYAHKPEALQGALRACRDLGSGRLLLVFGCGGDRDRGKRPLMGEIAARGADRIVVTSDNPRGEDPAAIIEQIMEAVPLEAEASVVVDRRIAIALALREAHPGDVVLIAGKGHERFQIMGDRRLPFDEREVVAEAVAALGRERAP